MVCPTPTGIREITMELLDGLVTVDETARQFRTSKRTVQRMMERREVSFVYIGKKPFIHVELSRAALMSRIVKPAARGRRK
jgi:excisionase family DNA binding protein